MDSTGSMLRDALDKFRLGSYGYGEVKVAVDKYNAKVKDTATIAPAVECTQIELIRISLTTHARNIEMEQLAPLLWK